MTSNDIAAELAGARRQAFVGRSAEIAALHAVLTRSDGHLGLYVYGMGGTGKSTLLRRLADEARATGRDVAEIDAARMTEALPESPAALVIDNVPDDLLPEDLPEDLTLVLAGRAAPDPSWARAGFRVIRLNPLSAAEASEFLARRGVPEHRRASIVAFAHGHPLALSLAAVTGSDRPEVSAALLERIVGELPGPEHRRALEASAHVLTTTEEVLRAVVGDRAGELAGWLRDRPYIEITRRGLRPHPVVRAAVDADLKWRDPEGYQRLHEQVSNHLLRRARSAGGTTEASNTVASLYELVKQADETPPAGVARRRPYRAFPVRAEDHPELLRLAEAEGSRTAVAHWLDARPGAFRAFRDPGTDEAVGFVCTLIFDDPDTDTNPDAGPDADPVTAAARAHLAEAPLRPGEQWLIERFALSSPGHRRPGLGRRFYEHSLALYMRTPRLAWSFIAVPEGLDVTSMMSFLDHRAIAPPGHGHALYAHDWRTVPAEVWLRRASAGKLFGPEAMADGPAPVVAVLSQERFATAVHDLLRAWHRQAAFEQSPLLHSRIAAGRGPAALRDVLSGAVAMLGDPTIRSVVGVTYFGDFATQHAVAEHLRIPFSSYRRYLTRGVDLVCADLWRREVGS